MRILFVAPYVPSPIRVRPYNFLRELSRRHEVTLLATDAPSAAAEAELLRTFCKRVVLVPLRPLDMASSCSQAAFFAREPLQSAVCMSPRLRRALTHLVESEAPEVVHVEHLRAAKLGTSIPKGIGRVYDAVDSISLLLERTLSHSHSLRQRILARIELVRTRRFEGQVLRLFDAVAVTSSDDAETLRSLPGAHDVEPVVIPNGVDLQWFQPLAAQPLPATIVLSGKMSYHANVSAALHFIHRIWPLVLSRRPDAQLVIAGSKPPASLQQLANASGGSIRVTGYLPDLRPTIGTATLSVCPVTVKVGIQNKILESMALAVPVVASRAGAAGLAAVEGRDLLVADSEDQFADQVLQFLSNRELRNRVGQAGRRYVQEQHRWDVATTHLERLYQHATTRERPRLNAV